MWADFIDGFELFRDPILCGVLAGLVLGYLGVFVVLRRMVFVTATISQSAGLGVALAFFAEIHLGFAVDPAIGAVILSLAATLIFALPSERLKLSRESILGAAYVASGAFAIIIGDKIAQEAHDIAAILFGTAVLVRSLDLYLVAAAGAVITAIHLLWHRGFIFASFDPDGARVQGLPVRFLDTVMWTLLALEVSFATRALGVLPVFAFAVLPAMSALLFAVRPGRTMLLAAFFGAISGGAGYLGAYFFALPVGAAQAATATLLFMLMLGLSRIRRA
jgi:zinc transport system permease protein